MKLTIPTKTLQSALGRVSRVPGAGAANPFIHAVKLDADMAGLTMARFSGEAKISLTIDNVDVSDEGAVIVNHSSLATLVSRMPGASVELNSDDTYIHIKSGAVKAKLQIMPNEVEQDPPEISGEVSELEMPASELANVLSLTLPSVSKDTNRPALCGVCVRMMQGRLAFIASDSRRCHIVFVDCELPVDCVIATESAEAIIQTIGNGEEVCVISFGENMMSVVSPVAEIHVSLIVEKFPNVENFLTQPESSIKSKIQIHKESLLDALKTCSIAGSGESRFVGFDFSKSGLNLLANNDKDSEIDISLDCSATAKGRINVPAIQMASAMSIIPADEAGDMEITVYPQSILLKDENRVAFIALKA